MSFKFNVGERVKDLVTGYEGLISCRTEFLTGCNRYGVQSEVLSKDRERPQDPCYFDENQLQSLGTAKVLQEEKVKKEKGGPREDTPKASMEIRQY